MSNYFRLLTLIILGLLVAFAVGAAVGCTDNEVSFNTAEDARKQAREQAATLAQEYRAVQGLTEFKIDARGDSTIDRTCPQGDGWASVDLKAATAGDMRVIKLKCSTVSAGMGCMTEEDFKKRANYANQEGRCNSEIPFPLPKLSK